MRSGAVWCETYLTSVMDVFTLNAAASSAAPSGPMLLALRLEPVERRGATARSHHQRPAGGSVFGAVAVPNTREQNRTGGTVRSGAVRCGTYSTSVMDVFTLNAAANSAAPSFPMWLS